MGVNAYLKLILSELSPSHRNPSGVDIGNLHVRFDGNLRWQRGGNYLLWSLNFVHL